MVVIRLARSGTRNSPFYHVTVADHHDPRDGRFIERIGFYNPIAQGQAERVRLDLDRVDYWKGVGAQLSPRVKRLVWEMKKLNREQATRVEEVAESEDLSSDSPVDSKVEDPAELEVEASTDQVVEESSESAVETPSDAEEEPSESKE